MANPDLAWEMVKDMNSSSKFSGTGPASLGPPKRSAQYQSIQFRHAIICHLIVAMLDSWGWPGTDPFERSQDYLHKLMLQ
jgi:hypothetical protein